MGFCLYVSIIDLLHERLDLDCEPLPSLSPSCVPGYEPLPIKVTKTDPYEVSSGARYGMMYGGHDCEDHVVNNGEGFIRSNRE